MIALLIQLGIVVILVAAAWQLSGLLPQPMGRVVQIVVFAIAGVWLLMLLGALIGGVEIPRLR